MSTALPLSFPAPPSRGPTGDSPKPGSYLRRVAVPPMDDGQELARPSSTSLGLPSRQTPPHPTRIPSSASTAKPSRSSPPTLAFLPSRIAGPSSGKLHQLIPDPPSFNTPPSYPPHPPPRGAAPSRSAITTSYDRNRMQDPSPSNLNKRDAYLHNKQRLAGKTRKDEEEEGLIRLGSNGSSADTLHLESWDVSEETKFLDLPRTIISPPRLDPKIIEPFSVHGIPSAKLIWSAGMCEVLDEMGHSVKFRDLISKDPKRKTLVFFIRHIFCGQCQDFVNNSIRELDPVALKSKNVDVIIISNGHWQVIKKYRELFGCPFPMFVDGGRRIYNYLGMTLMNNDFGSLRQSDRSRYNVKTVPGQLVSGIGNGLFRMPLRHPGKLTQLGGEFVFGPASTIHFAHRMQHTSDHWEAVDVAEKAGVDPDSHFQNLSLTPINSSISSSQIEAQQRVQAQLAQSLAASQKQAAEELAWQRDWEQRREAELDRIHRKKLERRAGRLRDSTSRLSSPNSNAPRTSTPPRVPGNGMMTREEFEQEMLARERERAWEAYQEQEKHRPWTEEETEEKLTKSLSCVRVTGEPGEEYEEEEEEEEEEEQYVQYGDDQEHGFYEEEQGYEGEQFDPDQEEQLSPELRKSSLNT